MMQIINTETFRFPMTVDDVIAEEQAAGVLAVIGDGYTGHGPYRVVVPLERPAHDPLTEFVVPLAPEADADGEWSQAFAVRAMLPEDIEQALQVEQARLAGEVTARRWEVETGGITLPGDLRIDTARGDQDAITRVLVNAQAAGITEVRFKAASGWVELSIEQLRQIANAVALHVQACYDAEHAHHEAIEGLTTLAQARAYDVHSGWPA